MNILLSKIFIAALIIVCLYLMASISLWIQRYIKFYNVSKEDLIKAGELKDDLLKLTKIQADARKEQDKFDSVTSQFEKIVDQHYALRIMRFKTEKELTEKMLKEFNIPDSMPTSSKDAMADLQQALKDRLPHIDKEIENMNEFREELKDIK